MTTPTHTPTNISIFEDRATAALPGNRTAQFIVWDLEPKEHENFKTQLDLIIKLGANFEKIEAHMRMQGFEMELEDIFETNG